MRLLYNKWCTLHTVTLSYAGLKPLCVPTNKPTRLIKKQNPFTKHVLEKCADFLQVAQWGHTHWKGKETFTTEDHLQLLKRSIEVIQGNGRSITKRVGDAKLDGGKGFRGKGRARGEIKCYEEPSLDECKPRTEDFQRNQKLGGEFS